MKSNLIGLIFGVLFFAGNAHATTTVYASNYSQGFNTSNPLGTTISTIYYPYSLTYNANPGPFVYFPPNVTNIPGNTVSLDMGATTNAVPINPGNAMYLAVTSTLSGTSTIGTSGTGSTTANSDTYVVVSVQENGASSTSPRYPVPIAYVATVNSATGFVACSNNTGECGATSGGFSYSALLPAGATIVIAIYPFDLCNPGSNASGVMAGCTNTIANGAPLPSPTPSGITPLSINVQAITDPGNSYADIFAAIGPGAVAPANGGAVDTAVSVQIDLQGSAGNLVCPVTSGQGADSLYFPGDKQIFLNTTGFGLSPGISPALQLLAYGNYSLSSTSQASVYSDPLNFSKNPLIDVATLGVGPQPPQISGGTSIGGFTDSNQNTSYYYTLGFAILDSAYFVNLPQASPSPGNCMIQNVQASQINGFLNKNACFIANAAYEDTNAAPLRMLREFRDGILLKTPRGREFVRWYYHWSPPAADWLRAHRVFRPVALLFLIPIEMIAWSILHPAGFFLFLTFAFFVLFCCAFFVFRRNEEASQ